MYLEDQAANLNCMGHEHLLINHILGGGEGTGTRSSFRTGGSWGISDRPSLSLHGQVALLVWEEVRGVGLSGKSALANSSGSTNWQGELFCAWVV